MRDIKFRAIPNKDFMINENQKNTLNSIAYYTKGEFYDDTFIYGYLADGYIIGKTIEAGEEYFVPSYWIPVEKETIGQYTGLKDKNGKEIYEGDIVRGCEGEIKTVVWKDNGFNFLYVSHRTYQGEPYTEAVYLKLGETNSKRWGVEIIGNIHENKELLEVK